VEVLDRLQTYGAIDITNQDSRETGADIGTVQANPFKDLVYASTKQIASVLKNTVANGVHYFYQSAIKFVNIDLTTVGYQNPSYNLPIDYTFRVTDTDHYQQIGGDSYP
jgi:hypothetical protein